MKIFCILSDNNFGNDFLNTIFFKCLRIKQYRNLSKDNNSVFSQLSNGFLKSEIGLFDAKLSCRVRLDLAPKIQLPALYLTKYQEFFDDVTYQYILHSLNNVLTGHIRAVMNLNGR